MFLHGLGQVGLLPLAFHVPCSGPDWSQASLSFLSWSHPGKGGNHNLLTGRRDLGLGRDDLWLRLLSHLVGCSWTSVDLAWGLGYLLLLGNVSFAFGGVELWVVSLFVSGLGRSILGLAGWFLRLHSGSGIGSFVLLSDNDGLVFSNLLLVVLLLVEVFLGM